MKQKQYMILEEYDQLKSLSDPLRCRIVSLLIAKSYTGQQLSQELDIPRAKIHYHLNELEKNGLIAVVKNEVKNGIIQKFYRSLARGFIPAAHLLPNSEEVGDFFRESTIHALERARMRAISAPERAFMMETEDRDSWTRMTAQIQLRVSEEHIKEFYKKFRALVDDMHVNELKEDDPNGRWYYLITSGFEIEEPWFDSKDLEEESMTRSPDAEEDQKARKEI